MKQCSRWSSLICSSVLSDKNPFVHITVRYFRPGFSPRKSPCLQTYKLASVISLMLRLWPGLGVRVMVTLVKTRVGKFSYVWFTLRFSVFMALFIS